MTQLDLFSIKSHPVFRDIQPHVVDHFWKFHTENPHVYELFKRFSADARNAGRRAYGSGAIFERIRWHVSIEVRGEDFKMNNNYRSCYSRLLCIEDPEFQGFFQLRRSA